MKRGTLPAVLISLILHLCLIGLGYIGWTTASKPVRVTSVAVEIVADAPSYEMAPAPVDELAVNQPEPTPSVDDVQPAPPTPEPQPIPVPQTPAAPAKPDKKPEPQKKDKATPPDPKGAKKPQPDKKKPAPAEENFLDRLSAAPSQSSTKRPAKSSTQATNGQSQRGNAPQDAGVQTDLAELKKRLGRAWRLSCDIPASRKIKPDIRFTLSPNGRVIAGPKWVNDNGDPVWEAGANLAIQAVRKEEPFTGLSDGVYGKPITITFDAEVVCRGR